MMTEDRGARWCRIVVRGELGDHYATRFPGMTLSRGDGVTILIGSSDDQAHLYGLLLQVQDLGLELMSLAICDPRGAVAATGTSGPPGRG